MFKNKPTKVVDEKPKATKKFISDREFVKIWMNADSSQAVAAQLGVTLSSASQRASSLRKRGVNLPVRQKRDYNSVEELNKLIERYSHEPTNH